MLVIWSSLSPRELQNEPKILLASFILLLNSKLSGLGSSGEITRRVDGISC